MKPKRMAYLEIPPLPFDIHVEFFKKLGFEIVLYHQLLSDADFLNVSDKLYDLQVDVILIYMDSPGIFYSKTSLEQFNQSLKIREGQEYHVKPRLIGWNRYVTSEDQVKYVDAFNGLFVGQNTKEEQIKEILQLPKVPQLLEEIKWEQIHLNRFEVTEDNLFVYYTEELGERPNVRIKRGPNSEVILWGWRYGIFPIYIKLDIIHEFTLDAFNNHHKLTIHSKQNVTITLGTVSDKITKALQWIKTANLLLSSLK